MFGKLTLFYNKNYIQLGLMKRSQLVQIHRTTIILKGRKKFWGEMLLNL